MSADGAVPTDDLACPFCCEPIRAGAVVCRHCRRDLSIPMPLLLVQREQAAEIARLRNEVLELQGVVAAGSFAPGEGVAVAGAARPADGRWLFGALGWVLALALVVGAHWLLVIRNDAPLVALRSAAILLPVTVAATMPNLWRLPGAVLVAASLALGVAAVTAMSWVVSVHDGTPVVPSTRRDFYEMAEFALSIGLSFLAGALATGVVRRRAEAGARLSIQLPGMAGIEAQTAQIKRLTENATLIATSATALAAGFRTLLS